MYFVKKELTMKQFSVPECWTEGTHVDDADGRPSHQADSQDHDSVVEIKRERACEGGSSTGVGGGGSGNGPN